MLLNPTPRILQARPTDIYLNSRNTVGLVRTVSMYWYEARGEGVCHVDLIRRRCHLVFVRDSVAT